MEQAISVERLGKFYRVGKKRSPVDFQRLGGFLGRLNGSSRPKPQRQAGVWALKDVSFDVAAGTVLGVIGPNGSGKTTLLKVIGRVTLPTEGRVRGRGRVVSLLELGAGFQPDLTGRENILLSAALYGIPRSEVVRRLDDIIEFAELQKFIDTPVKRYSSGMYVRLAFSVAINMQPDILLADEVLAVGDIAFRERCLQRIEEAGSTGLTVLFVSHDMAAISRLCSRAIWLNTGRVVEDGEASEVVAKYESSAWMLAAASQKKRSRNGLTLQSEHGQIRSVQLRSAEGSEIGAVRVSDEVWIRVNVALQTIPAYLGCTIDVLTKGITAFRTVLPENPRLEHPGIYSFSLRIPPDLLSETIYTVDAYVNIMDGEYRHIAKLEQASALSFKVYGTEHEAAGRRVARQGVVTPRLDWRVEAVGRFEGVAPALKI